MMPPDGTRSHEVERQRNLATADAWSWYAEHRAIVTSLLISQGGPDKSLCLLGAGNFNDVELPSLLARYQSIDAVDVDEEAMRRGLQRQSVAAGGRLHLHGGADISGLPGQPSPDDEESLIRMVENSRLALPRADYDVVASLCLLSQLIDQAARGLGPDHPRLLDLIRAIRGRHLGLIADHLRPGGRLLLVTDFVSSDTCPELTTIPPAAIPRAASQWLTAGNFFTGLNPAVLRRSLTDDPAHAHQWSQVRMAPPWRWRISERRAFAVYAIEATRHAD